MFPSKGNQPLIRDHLRPAPAGLVGANTNREDSIWELIEGAPHSLVTDPPNRWRLLWESPPGLLISPSVVQIDLSDPFNLYPDTHRMALVWDDQMLAAPLMSVEEGDTILVDIEQIQGARLSIWLENIGEAHPLKVSVRPIAERENLEAQLAERAKEDPLSKLGQGAKDAAADVTSTMRMLGWGALAVLALVGIVWASGQAKT